MSDFNLNKWFKVQYLEEDIKKPNPVEKSKIIRKLRNFKKPKK